LTIGNAEIIELVKKHISGPDEADAIRKVVLEYAEHFVALKEDQVDEERTAEIKATFLNMASFPAFT